MRVALAPIIARAHRSRYVGSDGKPISKEAYEEQRQRSAQLRRVKQREAAHDKQWLKAVAYPVLNETARYWQGRSVLRHDDRGTTTAHILGVMGPGKWRCFLDLSRCPSLT